MVNDTRGVKRPNLNNSNNLIDEEASGDNVSNKLKDFLLQLENLDESTKDILKITNDAAVGACLSNLCAMAKAASLLLQTLPARLQSLEKEIATIPQKITDSIKEETRLRSVVISNLTESNATTSTGRAKSDLKKIEGLLDFMEIEELPAATFRMGKSVEGRPRLLKVIFQHRGAASAVLRKRGNLRSSAFSKIQIRESLTPEELASRQSQIQERIRRNGVLGETELKENPWIFYAGVLQRRKDIRPGNSNRNGNGG